MAAGKSEARTPSPGGGGSPAGRQEVAPVPVFLAQGMGFISRLISPFVAGRSFQAFVLIRLDFVLNIFILVNGELFCKIKLAKVSPGRLIWRIVTRIEY